MENTHIGVLGAGAWGTALAIRAARANNTPIALWAREAAVCEAINTRHENLTFLPDIKLPPTIHATNNAQDLAVCRFIFMVVPAQFARAVLADFAPIMSPKAQLILCAKGIERASGLFMSQLAAEYLAPAQIAVLSGPSFAADVARDKPTAVTLAASTQKRGAAIAKIIGGAYFRPYLSTDCIGAEIGGAVKNVLAIACGIVAGRQMGESARAALTARGFAEMSRLGRKLGAQSETLVGLAGLGDLILTCASSKSRNFSLGVALGEGQRIADILGARASVSEGAMSAQALCALADKHKIDMPICAAVRDIVAEATPIDTAIAALLARPLGAEKD